MGVVPKKLSFQLRFRNKTKTRKILSRDFRLQGLLKKDLNNSNRFYYPFVKKKEQQHLLKNPFMASSLKIRKGVGDTRFVKKAKVHFSKDLKNNHLGLPETYNKPASLCPKFRPRGPIIKEKAKSLLSASVAITVLEGVRSKLKTRGKKSYSNLIRSNQYLCAYNKQSFFRPSWFNLTRIKINNNYRTSVKKAVNCNLQLTEGQIDYNTLQSQKFLSTSKRLSKNKFLSFSLRDYIFLKRKGAVLGRSRANKLLFGRYGICFKQYSIISSKCAETAKLDIAKNLRKKGRSWIRICCDTPYSARPAETRMGKGKGSVSYWAAKVSPGQLFFEFSGVSVVQLKEIYQTLCKKSAVSLKMVY